MTESIQIKQTDRGFPRGEFRDQYNQECHVQISSLATERCIWLGLNKVKPQILAKDAIRMGIDTDGETTGWIDFNVPKEVLIHGAMHLSMDDVKRLLPTLQKFAETGDI